MCNDRITPDFAEHFPNGMDDENDEFVNLIFDKHMAQRDKHPPLRTPETLCGTCGNILEYDGDVFTCYNCNEDE